MITRISSSTPGGLDLGATNYSGRIMALWQKKLNSLDSGFRDSLVESSSECRDTLRRLSQQLVNSLKGFEDQLSKIPSDNEFQKTKITKKWQTSIKEWKAKVLGIKCHQKTHLSELIKQHCDFLMNLNQFHPDYIRWKISRIILETNKIISFNDEAFRKTEESLFNRFNTLIRDKDKSKGAPDDTEAVEEHDAINVNYDDYELEEELKRRGELLIEEVEDLRYETTLLSLLDLLSSLRITLSGNLGVIKNYLPWNTELQLVVDHVENCKATIIEILISFIDMAEPLLREELLSSANKLLTEITAKERSDIERWLENVSYFDFNVQSSLKLIQASLRVWNQHVCRIETVRRLVLQIIRDLLINQHNQQMSYEMKINMLLDEIREASKNEDIEFKIKAVDKHFQDIMNIYQKTYDAGMEELKDFTEGCRHAKELFCAESNAVMLDVTDASEFPQHGSETDITLDAMTDLHHWEIIKQLFVSVANWSQGLVEGMYLLCQIEKAGSEELWLKGLANQLEWVKDLKVQIMERRKERLENELALPRLVELQNHIAVLESHTKGLKHVFSERFEAEDDYKCALLTMAKRVKEEYEDLLNSTAINDDYHRIRFVGRINKFECDIKQIEESKNKLKDSLIDKTQRKYFWLQKANYGMLKYIRLFYEGGSFNSSEAIDFIKKISDLQVTIATEEKLATDSIVEISKSTNPLKDIKMDPLVAKRETLYYKIKKNGLEETSLILIESLRETIRVELATAREVCTGLCEALSCNDKLCDDIPLKLADMASYLIFPAQSSKLECEDIQYLDDITEEPVTDLVGIPKDEVISQERAEELSKKDDGNQDVCQEILEATALDAFSRGRKGALTKGKDGSKSSKTKDSKKSKDEKDGSKSSKTKDPKNPKKSKDDNGKKDKKGKKAEGKTEVKEAGGKNKKKDDKRLGNAYDTKGGKKGQVEKGGRMEIGPGGERLDVLRDTICEQLRRLQENQDTFLEEEERLVSPTGITSKDMLAKKKKSGKTERMQKAERTQKAEKVQKGEKNAKKKSTKKNSTTKSINKDVKNERDGRNNKESESAAHPSGAALEDSDLVGGRLLSSVNRDFLFRYTPVPIEMMECNFLLCTKKSIFEMFSKIQKISRKFFMVEGSEDEKPAKTPDGYSPTSDSKEFTSRILKILRFLNIQCEQAWFILSHDFVCLMRMYQSIIEERIERDLISLEEHWKIGFCNIIINYDKSLSSAVSSKTKRTDELMAKFEVETCDDNKESTDILIDGIKSQCNTHVKEIKNIWIEYSKGLSDKYLELKQDLASWSEEAINSRFSLTRIKTNKSFLKIMKEIITRYENFLSQSLNYVEDEVRGRESLTPGKNNEINKLKSLQFLLKVVLSIIKDFETNYSENSLAKNADQLSEQLLKVNPKKVDIPYRIRYFLQEAIRNIRKQHSCFKFVCADQATITLKWLQSLETENKTNRNPQEDDKNK